MKKQTGIWIDTTRAVIVTIQNNKVTTKEIKSDVENRIYHYDEGDTGTFIGLHHSNNENKFQNRHNQELSDFYKNVLEEVKSSDELYFFGPAEAKTELKKKLYDQKTIEISKLKSVETADKLTPNQIIAHVKDYFEQFKE